MNPHACSAVAASCPDAPAVHVVRHRTVWTGTVAELACPAHAAEIRERRACVGAHPYDPATCSHPRSWWSAAADRCVIGAPRDHPPDTTQGEPR